MGLTLSGSQRTACAEIVTIENTKLEHPREFKVNLEVRGQSGVQLEQDLVTVEISDNDGEKQTTNTQCCVMYTHVSGGGYTHSYVWNLEGTKFLC